MTAENLAETGTGADAPPGGGVVVDRVAASVAFLAYKVGSGAGGVIERALGPIGLRGRHVRVLGMIHDQTLSQRDLCELTGMDRTTMVSVIDELERQGYASRERGVTDRRKYVVRLTDRGQDAFAAAAKAVAVVENEFLDPLDRDERAQFHRLLAKLYAASDPTCQPAEN